MTQAAHEARWRLEAGLDDDSVELLPMPRATFDLIMGWIWFVIWETLGIVLLLGPAVSPRSYRGQFEIVGGLAVGIAFMAVGLIFVVRHRWVARPGGMVRQMLLPFVPLKWERSYTGLTNFEVYKGIWRSGRGTSNVLRFYITGRPKPVTVDDVTTLRPRPFVDHNLTVEAHGSDLSALGKLLADRTGVPITFRTEDIDQPPAPD